VSHGISAAPEAVVWAAVRPEKIFMSATQPHARRRRQRRRVRDRQTSSAAPVQDIAYLGDLSIYLVKLPRARSCG